MRRDKTFWAIVTACILLIGVGAFLFLKTINAEPDVRIPTPRMPTPNAYDYYVAAGKALVDNDKVSDAISVRPSTQYSANFRIQLLRKNAKALSLLRRGFRYRYLHPPVRARDQSYLHNSLFRDLARLLMLEARVNADGGRWGEAAHYSLEAVQLGQDVPKGGDCITVLTGFGCQAIGRAQLWEYVDHLDASDAGLAAKQMEGLNQGYVPLANVLREEKWHTVSELSNAFRRRGWRQSLMETADQQREIIGLMGAMSPAFKGMGQPDSKLDSFSFKFHCLTCSKRASIAAYMRYMDARIVDAGMPYVLRKPAPIPNDPLMLIVCNPTMMDTLGYYHARTRAQNELLAVRLALQAYDAAHGALPRSLQQLTPTYLARIPDDPFAPKGSIRYKRIDKTFILYSVGPDGKDDGGKAVYDPQARQGWEHNVYPDTKGDIVAGVNIH